MFYLTNKQLKDLSVDKGYCHYLLKTEYLNTGNQRSGTNGDARPAKGIDIIRKEISLT